MSLFDCKIAVTKIEIIIIVCLPALWNPQARCLARVGAEIPLCFEPFYKRYKENCLLYSHLIPISRTI